MARERPTTAEGPHPRPPEMKLGTVAQGGLAPAILAVVERGASQGIWSA